MAAGAGNTSGAGNVSVGSISRKKSMKNRDEAEEIMFTKVDAVDKIRDNEIKAIYEKS